MRVSVVVKGQYAGSLSGAERKGQTWFEHSLIYNLIMSQETMSYILCVLNILIWLYMYSCSLILTWPNQHLCLPCTSAFMCFYVLLLSFMALTRCCFKQPSWCLLSSRTGPSVKWWDSCYAISVLRSLSRLWCGCINMCVQWIHWKLLLKGPVGTCQNCLLLWPEGNQLSFHSASLHFLHMYLGNLSSILIGISNRTLKGLATSPWLLKE